MDMEQPDSEAGQLGQKTNSIPKDWRIPPTTQYSVTADKPLECKKRLEFRQILKLARSVR
jgi:hypothetical protein